MADSMCLLIHTLYIPSLNLTNQPITQYLGLQNLYNQILERTSTYKPTEKEEEE